MSEEEEQAAAPVDVPDAEENMKAAAAPPPPPDGGDDDSYAGEQGGGDPSAAAAAGGGEGEGGEPLPEGASVAESAAMAAEQLMNLEAEQDEEERKDDEELAAVVAAAGAEIDAFLSMIGESGAAGGAGDDDDGEGGGGELSSSSVLSASSRKKKAELAEKERAVGTAVLQYDRAKGALGALSERMEAVQRELENLSGERDDVARRVVEMGGPGEPSIGAAAMGRVTDEEMSTLPRRRNLEREASEYDAQIAMQRDEVSQLDPRVNNARRQLTDAENEVALIEQMRAEVAAVGEGEYRLASRKASRSNAKDAKAVARYATAKREAETRRRVEEDMAREADDAVVSAALGARAAAIRRVAEGLAVVRANLEACDAEDLATHKHDVKRLMELKDSTEAAFEQLTKFVAAKQSAHKAKKMSQRDEAVGLLAKGINPHTVFRKRDEDRRVARAKRRNAASHEARVAHIRQRLAREEALHVKEKEARRATREHAEYFAKVTGNEAREERVKKYMQASIRDGRDVLDPTGRRPVHPSVVSTAKPLHFGLGLKDDPELTEIVAGRHPGTEPTSLLLTHKEKALRTTYPGGAGTIGRNSPTLVPVTNTTAGRSSPRNAVEAKAEDGLGLEDDEAAKEGEGEEEEDFDVVEKREKKKAMDRKEAQRMMEKTAKNLSKPGRLYSSQVVCGREFKGDAFIPTPKMIVFRDFEVGKKYKQRCSLTNISYTFNTFKVMDIDIEYRGFFDVEYEFPGRMSAGMSSDVFLTFTPQVATAFATTLPLSTNTGVVHVPLECYPKSADVFTPTPVIDFTTVTVGETVTLDGELENAGAIPVPFTVLASKPRNPDAPPSQFTVRVKGSKAKEGKESKEGVVPGYGKTGLAVRFDPVEDGGVEEDVVVRLGAPLNRDVVISLRGVGGPVPVHLDGRNVVDFRAVALGCSYRDALVVHNRGSSAAKCVVKVPHELRGFVEVIPDMIFCQAKSSAVFSVKLSPNAETARRCAKHTNPETGALEVPMRVQVPGQAVPVDFTLRALLTTSDLTFDPPKLDFGHVFLGETGVIKLRVTNHSLLMQQYGFVGLPATTRVKPSPYGEILANETVELEVSYAPPVVSHADFNLTLKSLMGGRVFHVPCKARGVKPSLQLSANLITLPPTAEREMSSGSVFVRNKSRVRETFEIVVPEDAKKVLKVSPHVGVLAPGEAVRVQVAFCPETKPRVSSSGGEGGATTADGDGGDGGGKEGEEAAPGEPVEVEATAEGGNGDDGDDDGGVRFSSNVEDHNRPSTASAPEPQCDVFRLPLFLKSTNGGGGGAGALPSGGGGGDDDDDDDEFGGGGHGTLLQHLEVRTVTHASAIAVDNLPEIAEAKEITYKLDFGPIAVGEQRVRAVRLRNSSEQFVDVSSTAPDHEGVFSHVTAFRPIDPHGTFLCKLNFTPHAVQKFFELVTIQTSIRTLRVALTGEGISPSLDVEPAAVIDVGDAAPGEASHQTMTVTNPTQFALKYQVELRDVVAPGSTNRCPFVCSPSGGIIQPGASAEVTVSFTPDRAGVYGVASQFTGRIAVSVPGLTAETARLVRARCWNEGVYVVGGDDPFAESLANSEKESESAGTGTWTSGTGTGTGATGVAATGRFLPPGDVLRESTTPPPFDVITLTLPQTVRPGETASAALEIGSLKGADGKGANGEWSFDDFDEEATRRGWSCDAGKGTVEAGTRKPVTFTFAPPEEVRVGDLAYFGLAEWMETTVTCRLKGGVPAPTEAEGREVRVTVRCHLEPPAPKKQEDGEGAAAAAAAQAEE